MPGSSSTLEALVGAAGQPDPHCAPWETLLRGGTVPCPLVPPSHLPVQEPGVELDILLPVQGLFWEGRLGLDATWQQKGREGCSPLSCQTAGRDCPCWGAQAQYLSCRGQTHPAEAPASGSRPAPAEPNACGGESRVIPPSWVPTRLAGLGVPLAGPPPIPTREETAVPDGGDARGGVQGSLDHKHLRLR